MEVCSSQPLAKGKGAYCEVLKQKTSGKKRQFSGNSFGFLPKRSTHKALFRCKRTISEGYKYAIDMDMVRFFDTVNHSKLIEILSRTVEDGRVNSLVHKYLNADVVVGHKFENTEAGVPHGGPLSPLLSNIMLNELDKELHKRGHKFALVTPMIWSSCVKAREQENG